MIFFYITLYCFNDAFTNFQNWQKISIIYQSFAIGYGELFLISLLPTLIKFSTIQSFSEKVTITEKILVAKVFKKQLNCLVLGPVAPSSTNTHYYEGRFKSNTQCFLEWQHWNVAGWNIDRCIFKRSLTVKEPLSVKFPLHPFLNVP